MPAILVETTEATLSCHSCSRPTPHVYAGPEVALAHLAMDAHGQWWRWIYSFGTFSHRIGTRTDYPTTRPRFLGSGSRANGIPNVRSLFGSLERPTSQPTY